MKVSEQSFAINLHIMRAFGLYTSKESTPTWKVISYLMYTIFMLPVPLFGTLYFIFDTTNFDMMRLNDNAFLIAEISCQFTKLFPFIRDADRVRKCIHYFENSVFRVLKPREVTILQECIDTCVRNSKVYVFAVFSINIIWASKPFFEKDYRLPVDLWLPFDPTTGPVIYYPVFVALVIGKWYYLFVIYLLIVFM